MLLLEAGNIFILVKVKPFDNISNNLIELVNEVFFVMYCGSQLYLNTKNRWNDRRAQVFIYTMIANNAIILIILISMLDQ